LTRFVRILLIGLFVSLTQCFAMAAAVVKVTPAEQAALNGIIQEMYVAFEKRDVNKVLSMLQPVIESSALEYEASGKGKAEEVRDAFRGCFEEVMTHKDYKVKELRMEDVQYRRDASGLVVVSVLPIIATERVEIMGEGSGQYASLNISQLWFRKKGAGYELFKMSWST
jgi:hypothetical protein